MYKVMFRTAVLRGHCFIATSNWICCRSLGHTWFAVLSFCVWSLAVLLWVCFTGDEMAGTSFGHLISGWNLSQEYSQDLPQSLDDAEDFKLTKAKNSEQFGPPLSKQTIDRALWSGFLWRHERQWSGSLVCFARGMMPEALLNKWKGWALSNLLNYCLSLLWKCVTRTKCLTRLTRLWYL